MPAPPVGIGHLTMLDVAPPELVSVAADAGFDAVGVRAAVAAPGEEAWPVWVGSRMLADMLRRMDDTGVRVNDVEIIRLTPRTTAAEYLPLFETGARLGARFVNVIAFDPDLGRTAETLAALDEAAAPFGLRPSVEAMPYSAVPDLDAAVRIVGGSGAGIIVDPLHLRRSGDSPDHLRRLDPAVLSYYQLCDAPLATPSGLARPARMPRGQAIGTGDLQLEARSARLLPGDGELPLAEIVSAMPPGLTVSVEAPNLALLEQLGAREFARRARAAVARFVGVDAPPAVTTDRRSRA